MRPERPSDPHLLRFGAHGQQGRSAPMLEHARHLTIPNTPKTAATRLALGDELVAIGLAGHQAVLDPAFVAEVVDHREADDDEEQGRGEASEAGGDAVGFGLFGFGIEGRRTHSGRHGLLLVFMCAFVAA